jgi:hypothetical protein
MATFLQIFFSLWEAKNTGRLLLQTKTKQKTIRMKQGDIAIDKDSFPESSFLHDLSKKKILDSSTLKKYESSSQKNKLPLLSFLLDSEVFSPTQLWKHMERFAKEELFPFFNLFPLDSSFAAEDTLQDSSILFTLPTLDLLHEGVYHMQNFEIIDALIPQETKNIQKLSSQHSELIQLKPFEKYVLRILGDKNDLQDIYASSALGLNVTKKTIFALFSLGIIGSSPLTTPNKPLQEFSAAELHKIFDTFNAKCSYIFKYVSKELGPVAINFLEKSIEEIKPHLSPHFQNIRLNMNGKIELQSVLKSNMILSDRNTRLRLIKFLNEILAAEILAVKKTLGNEAESIVLKNLEKISA